MEGYGGDGDERFESDPSPEWTARRGETGIAGLGGRGESYPERPNEPDCIYYMRTGFCGYGSRCRFNHPRDRGMVMGANIAGAGEYPERIGQPICQFYMRTGTCKFGASCKYHHPRQGAGSISPLLLNYLGYPLRPGEKECSYYMKTGQCKFGKSCKFHHPVAPGIQIPPLPPVAQVPPMAAPAVYPTVQSISVPSSQQYSLVMARPPLMPGSYLQSPYGSLLLSPGLVPYPGLSPYPPSAASSSIYGSTPLSPSAPAYTRTYRPGPSSVDPSSSLQMDHSFPYRPGQPECQYYMKTGDCKFGSSCRYHYPPEAVAPKTSFGLPLRPGAATCAQYVQHGICKFGPACKFDHPIGSLSYSPSASSLTDVPVAPYAVGSSVGTLAPSSSSSNLRPELSSAVGRITELSGSASKVPESDQSSSS